MAAPDPAPTAIVPAAESSSQAWDGEPTTVGDLDLAYESVLTIPARAATCQLRVVKATPKDGSDPTNIVEDQKHKLFIATPQKTL